MGIALYRKYRPQTFSDVSGQNHVKITLQNEISLSKISHAYLFCGPRGVGKTTLARIFSKAVNCLNIGKEGEPCNECANCKNFLDGKSMDIIEIDAASHTGVDNVRENIISNARFTPHQSKFKVFIIDEVHMLSISAFNALLKILEEPPEHIIFILATTEIHKVPVTIISRCQRFDFKKINVDDLINRLKFICRSEGVEVEEDVFKLIAKHSEGCQRDAESLLEQILSMDAKKITLDLAELVVPKSNFDLVRQMVEHFASKDTAMAVKQINLMLEQGVDLSQFTDDLIEFLRKALIYKIDNNLVEFSNLLEAAKQADFLKTLEKFSQQNIIYMLNVLFRRKVELKNCSIMQLPLELAVIEIIYGAEKKETQNFAPQNKENQSMKDLDEKVSRILEDKKLAEKAAAEEKIESQNLEPQDATPRAPASFDSVKQNWPQVLEGVKKHSYSLFINMNVGELVSLNQDTLNIAFPYELQRASVSKAENNKVIQNVVSEVCGFRVGINAIVDLELNRKKQESVKEVLDVFGAQIIE